MNGLVPNENRHQTPQPNLHSFNDMMAKAQQAFNHDRLVELAILCDSPTSAQNAALNEGFYIEKLNKKLKPDRRNPVTGESIPSAGFCQFSKTCSCNIGCEWNKKPGAYAVYCLGVIKRDYLQLFQSIEKVKRIKEKLIKEGRMVLSDNVT